LMQSFRRHLELLAQLRHLRGQLRQRRCGITPDAEGDEGQKNLGSSPSLRLVSEFDGYGLRAAY
jgi:hypothetical protein